VPADAQPGQQFRAPGPGLAPRHPGELGGQQHVTGHGQVIEQVEELEDHPHLAAPVPRRPGLAHAVDPLPGHGHRPAARLVESGDQVQQRGFPAARRAHHRHRLPPGDGQADPVQRRPAAPGIPPGDLAELDQHLRAVAAPVTTGRGVRHAMAHDVYSLSFCCLELT